jgi:hypothetical protein
VRTQVDPCHAPLPTVQAAVDEGGRTAYRRRDA